MKLERTKEFWNKLSDADAMWAVLSNPEKFGGRWTAAEFFETGIAEIDAVLRRLESLGIEFQHSDALDFGCGLGRLTRAIAKHFSRTTGVDVAPAMIDRARQLSEPSENCSYLVNDTDDLSQFSDRAFDFIYSRLVLQHMNPATSLRYIREFGRVLRPEGVLVFQIPEPNRDKPWLRLIYYLRRFVGASPTLVRAYRRMLFRHADADVLNSMPTALMEMEGIDRQTVANLLTEIGVAVISVDADHEQNQGLTPSKSWLYYCIKRQPNVSVKLKAPI